MRYDQLANRWLYVMPIFRRPANDSTGPYSMCYALSQGADPTGPFYRYEFKRPLFPDYPRPAVWPDGYYIPTSTSDDFIQKHACVVERAKMLKGLPAREQCIVIDGVNFLNNADIDGRALPPAGAPNIMMAAGGTQLNKVFEDDGIYFWKFHVDWNDTTKTKLTGPVKIAVAPYHYLCDGQLTNCVLAAGHRSQARRAGRQDHAAARVPPNVNGHESIVALHSVNTAAGGGGVRWYEFRLDKKRDPVLYQQGTFAPDGFLPLDAEHRHGQEGEHRDRLFVRRHAELRRPAIRRAARERSARQARLARDDSRERRGRADEHAALGGLHHDSRWTRATIAPSGTWAITTRRARRPTRRGSAAFGDRERGSKRGNQRTTGGRGCRNKG